MREPQERKEPEAHGQSEMWSLEDELTVDVRGREAEGKDRDRDREAEGKDRETETARRREG